MSLRSKLETTSVRRSMRAVLIISCQHLNLAFALGLSLFCGNITYPTFNMNKLRVGLFYGVLLYEEENRHVLLL